MPNGIDKNLHRLLMACALYRQRYDEWLAQARLHPLILHDLANVLDADQFAKLAAHVQIRTRDSNGYLGRRTGRDRVGRERARAPRRAHAAAR